MSRRRQQRAPELAGLLGAVPAEHGSADELIDAGADRRLGDGAQPRVHEHGLANGQLVDERVELRTVAEPALRLLERPRDAVAGQVCVAGRGAHVSRQHLERRRLARSVDAQQSEALALHRPTYGITPPSHTRFVFRPYRICIPCIKIEQDPCLTCTVAHAPLHR